ncbi:MAG: hypothetical protein Q7R62_01210 [bacterium]|nr:hypothetical protein [bacterium]
MNKMRRIGLISLIGLIAMPLSVMADDFTSTNFTVKDPVMESASYGTSTSFSLWGTIPYIASTPGSSTNFSLNPGFLAFPGMIVVSGRVFSDEGVTGATSTVKLAVGSSTPYTTSTDASGNYIFVNIIQPTSTILTVWMDNNGGGNGTGAAVTRYSSGNVADLDIYKNHLITRHEDAGPLTNSDISLCDKTTGGSCADSDLHFEVSTSTSAIVIDNDWGLYIWEGNTYTPGGTITLSAGAIASAYGGDIGWASSTSVLSMGSNALSIGGDWNNNSAGTFTISAGQTTTFNGTATGFSITRPGTFENLIFNGTGGGWTFAVSGATSTLDLTVTAGTLNSSTSTLDVNGNMTIGSGGAFQASSLINIAQNLTSSGTFSMSSSTVVFDTTATSTIIGKPTEALTFWNLTASTAGKPMVFSTSTESFRINGLLTLRGAAGNLISIDSTNSGSQWKINHQGTEDIQHVTVKDSGCVASSTYISVSYADSVDRGNNGFCWLFPSLSFTISPLSINLALGEANTFTANATNTLTISTNGSLGYSLTAYETAPLTRQSDTTTISDWTGTNTTPTTWTTTCADSSTCGFGYNTDDADLTQFSVNKFAAFTTSTNPGDEVAKSTAAVTDETVVMTYRASVSRAQTAGDYETTIRYIVAPKF